MRRALACALLIAVATVASAAQSIQQPLGRLFFTPEERAQLDSARAQKKPTPPQATAEAPEPPPTSQIVTYGGIVRRSDGKSMLWINNRLVEEKEALAGLNLKGKVRSDGAVTVQVPHTGGSVEMKVGQSIELQTGRIAETRRPPPETKAPPREEAVSPAADPKPAAAPPPPAAASRPVETPPEKKPAPGTVGLKLDLGNRAPQPAEEQQLRGRADAR